MGLFDLFKRRIPKSDTACSVIKTPDPDWQAGINTRASFSVTTVLDIPGRGIVATGCVRNADIDLGDTLVSRSGVRFHVIGIERLDSYIPTEMRLRARKAGPGDSIGLSLREATMDNLSAVDMLVKVN